MLRVATIALNHKPVGAGLLGSFHHRHVDLPVTGGVELVEVGLAVASRVCHPDIGLSITVGVGAEDDMMLIPLGCDHFFGTFVNFHARPIAPGKRFETVSHPGLARDVCFKLYLG